MVSWYTKARGAWLPGRLAVAGAETEYGTHDGCCATQFSAKPGVSDPRGGSVLWLELPEKVEAEQLFDQTIARQISIMPGDVFAAGKRYGNFIRISFGHPWSQSIEDGVEQLGSLVRSITG